LCNLVDNAVKYAPPDSEVAIEARCCEAGVEISVSDDGPGLAPGSESSIFEKFVRGQPESATTGVGLGLAICRAIVEAHGGSIRAENRPSGGARIAFTLPVGEAPAVDAALIARLEGELP
jgi:two-component system sensor histidine kinase KdpD